MAKLEMSLQSKLTSQKPKNSKIILIGIAISVLIIGVGFASMNSCGVRHVILIEDIKTYENSLDPELCYTLVENILEYNEQCNDSIEIFDCG